MDDLLRGGIFRLLLLKVLDVFVINNKNKMPIIRVKYFSCLQGFYVINKEKCGCPREKRTSVRLLGLSYPFNFSLINLINLK